MDYIQGVRSGKYRKCGPKNQQHDRTIVGKNIIALRYQRDVTQEKLASITGLARHTIDLIESGFTKDYKLSTLLAIAGALNVTLNDICYPNKRLKAPYE